MIMRNVLPELSKDVLAALFGTLELVIGAETEPAEAVLLRAEEEEVAADVAEVAVVKVLVPAPVGVAVVDAPAAKWS
jgi:hypothetical protein